MLASVNENTVSKESLTALPSKPPLNGMPTAFSFIDNHVASEGCCETVRWLGERELSRMNKGV